MSACDCSFIGANGIGDIYVDQIPYCIPQPKEICFQETHTDDLYIVITAMILVVFSAMLCIHLYQDNIVALEKDIK